jgi:hypothetical protein
VDALKRAHLVGGVRTTEDEPLIAVQKIFAVELLPLGAAVWVVAERGSSVYVCMYVCMLCELVTASVTVDIYVSDVYMYTDVFVYMTACIHADIKKSPFSTRA